jgi:hypothetical protein
MPAGAKIWTNKAEWTRALTEERQRFWNQIGQAQRILCLEATKSIVFKTPVDTGRARGNWQASIDSPLHEIAAGEDKNGGKTINKAARVIAGMKPLHAFFLSNNLPYIEALENGHSKQAPAGMVGVTIAEIEASGTLKDLGALIAGGASGGRSFTSSSQGKGKK